MHDVRGRYTARGFGRTCAECRFRRPDSTPADGADPHAAAPCPATPHPHCRLVRTRFVSVDAAGGWSATVRPPQLCCPPGAWWRPAAEAVRIGADGESAGNPAATATRSRSARSGRRRVTLWPLLDHKVHKRHGRLVLCDVTVPAARPPGRPSSRPPVLPPSRPPALPAARSPALPSSRSPVLPSQLGANQPRRRPPRAGSRQPARAPQAAAAAIHSLARAARSGSGLA
jgi:hypothetical protein